MSESTLLDDARYWLGQNWSQALQTHSDGCRRWHAGCLVHALVEEVRRLRLVICDRISELGEEMEHTHGPHATRDDGREQERCSLTPDERRAISEAADAYAMNDDDADCERIAATLRGLLERSK
jgi:hypothetical protein